MAAVRWFSDKDWTTMRWDTSSGSESPEPHFLSFDDDWSEVCDQHWGSSTISHSRCNYVDYLRADDMDDGTRLPALLNTGVFTILMYRSSTSYIKCMIGLWEFILQCIAIANWEQTMSYRTYNLCTISNAFDRDTLCIRYKYTSAC